jgi:hypothetical protein
VVSGEPSSIHLTESIHIGVFLSDVGSSGMIFGEGAGGPMFIFLNSFIKKKCTGECYPSLSDWLSVVHATDF